MNLFSLARAPHLLAGLIFGGACCLLSPLSAQPQREGSAVETPETVTINLATNPRVRAKVFHGKQLLGVTPLRLQFPTNSGSLDIVVRASGFLPVNTRIYTFLDENITVSLTRIGEESQLFGYRKQLDPEEE